MNNFHTPVLTREVIHALNIYPGKKYIDSTLGGAGHTHHILKAGGIVLGIDHDPEALEYAKNRLMHAYPAAQGSTLSRQKQQYILTSGNFKNIKSIARTHDFFPVSGILFDLGASTHQLTTTKRGFSFSANTKLDMRMDPELGVTASDLVNALGKKELYVLFTKFAQEKHARAIAAAIVSARKQKPITTTKELAQLVKAEYSRRFKTKSKIHPATKVFQALRIAVNDELNNLKTALPQAIELLKAQGRLVVISFHQGEDRIVKNIFNHYSQSGTIKIITKKPTTPTRQEIQSNPNARSAKLRVVEKNIDLT